MRKSDVLSSSGSSGGSFLGRSRKIHASTAPIFRCIDVQSTKWSGGAGGPEAGKLSGINWPAWGMPGPGPQLNWHFS